MKRHFRQTRVSVYTQGKLIYTEMSHAVEKFCGNPRQKSATHMVTPKMANIITGTDTASSVYKEHHSSHK